MKWSFLGCLEGSKGPNYVLVLFKLPKPSHSIVFERWSEQKAVPLGLAKPHGS